MKGKSIFVVDDDPMLAEMLKDHLEKNPMNTVRKFSTGEDCINHLGENPDVIVLDYQLNSVVPEAANGLEILEHIKGYNKDTCVIMLSSQDQYGKAAQTIIKGALEYVVKGTEAFQHIDDILHEMN